MNMNGMYHNEVLKLACELTINSYLIPVSFQQLPLFTSLSISFSRFV